MAHVNERIGDRACPVCGTRLVLRRNPAGTVTVNCSAADGCDFSGFAKKGTKAAGLLTAHLPAPAPAPGAPAAPPPPAPGKSSRTPAQPFGLANL